MELPVAGIANDAAQATRLAETQTSNAKQDKLTSDSRAARRCRASRPSLLAGDGVISGRILTAPRRVAAVLERLAPKDRTLQGATTRGPCDIQGQSMMVGGPQVDARRDVGVFLVSAEDTLARRGQGRRVEDGTRKGTTRGESKRRRRRARRYSGAEGEMLSSLGDGRGDKSVDDRGVVDCPVREGAPGYRRVSALCRCTS